MAKTIEAWDDPDFAEGRRTPADRRDVEFRIGDEVVMTLDLTDKHYRELIEDNARWIKLGQAVPPEVLKAVRRPGGAAPHRGNPGSAVYVASRNRRREMRVFADVLGRQSEYTRDGWTPAEGNRNKYEYGDELERDFDAWVAAGRPPPGTWASARQAS
jgi:hypothetical protein